ncbi:MAG: hypothetical protein ACI92G_001734 [Candidatus Pelagisphaera sp.]|jgi:hypothetical protein
MSKNWNIPRRSFLRGIGAMVALPLMESMYPSIRAFAGTAGNTAGGLPKRMAFVYAPNGKNMADWTPTLTGPDYDFPMILEPLRAFKKDMTIITGLKHEKANANGDGGGDHARSAATYLTGCQARKTDGADIRAGISVDQIAARKIGHQTRLPSLELSCDNGQREGTCESGYSCAYQFNLSWKSETMPINPEINPAQVFDRLFGTPNAAETAHFRVKREHYNKSLLDYVLNDAKSLKRDLGVTDSRKLDEYLTAVREIEQRVERFKAFPVSMPVGAIRPDVLADYTYEEYIRLMYDMQVLAFQSDSTRISTFIVAHDGSNRPYPQIGIKDGHHDLSHHRNSEEKKAKLAQINRFHTTQFAYFLERLKSVQEGDGSLLDNCIIQYGSCISNGNDHLHNNLPVILAGGGGGALKSGRHVRLNEETQMTNLYRSMLEVMDAPVEVMGDSTGKLGAVI